MYRHVGDDVELVEFNAVLFAQTRVVIGFELLLRGRQHRTLRVVDQIQRESRPRPAIAEAVKHLQCAYAGGEDPVAALAVDIFFKIAG